MKLPALKSHIAPFVALVLLVCSGCGNDTDGGKKSEPATKDSTAQSAPDTSGAESSLSDSNEENGQVAAGGDVIDRGGWRKDVPLSSLIRVEQPALNSLITSPLKVKGEAVGGWYFEAVFPITLYDSKGNILAEIMPLPQGEWMTENFVPFTGEREFEVPDGGVGRLVFERDNMTELEEEDRSLTIPVRFPSKSR
ncbi:MAG: Gmad2 immunoglobulin-like domain-containing protein [Candidatus Kapaibacterium sp.]